MIGVGYDSNFCIASRSDWPLPGTQFQSNIIIIPVAMLKVRYELSEGRCKKHCLV